MEKKKTIKVELEYNVEQACALWRYQIFFEKNLEKGNKIPARVIKNLFGILKFTEEEQKKQLKQQFETIKQATLDRFLNDNDYCFNYTKEIKKEDAVQTTTLFEKLKEITEESSKKAYKPNKPKKLQALMYKEVYSLEDMIDTTLKSLRNDIDTVWHNVKQEKRKETFCKDVYLSLNEYKKYLNKESQKLMTKYKLYVMTGFIAKLYGIPVGSEKNPTNSQIYQGIRHTLEKFIDKNGDLKKDKQSKLIDFLKSDFKLPEN